MKTQDLLTNSRVNIIAEGKRHLSAVIGSKEYRNKYVKDLVKDRGNQLTILSTIAEPQAQPQPQPQAARVLISLPTKYGGFTIPIFHETAENEFMISSKIKSALTKKVYSTI